MRDKESRHSEPIVESIKAGRSSSINPYITCSNDQYSSSVDVLAEYNLYAEETPYYMGALGVNNLFCRYKKKSVPLQM